MKFGKATLPLLAATGAVAMPSKAGADMNARDARDAGVQEHDKRFVWTIGLAGGWFFRYVNAFLNFMEEPPNAWETASGNCVGKSPTLARLLPFRY